MSDAAVAYSPAEADIHGPAATSTGVSNPKLGMWLFLGSDCLLFGALISTYLLYHNRPLAPGVPNDATKPIADVFSLWFTSASSFILLMSSLTMVLAVSALTRGEITRSRIWIGSTALLGSLFVSGQVFEFTEFLNKGFGYTTNVSTSAFYTLTGFHGVHVTVGVLMLLVLLALSLRGDLPQQRAEVVENVGLYWHFVDVVWIVIFTIVYLIK